MRLILFSLALAAVLAVPANAQDPANPTTFKDRITCVYMVAPYFSDEKTCDYALNQRTVMMTLPAAKTKEEAFDLLRAQLVEKMGPLGFSEVTKDQVKKYCSPMWDIIGIPLKDAPKKLNTIGFYPSSFPDFYKSMQRVELIGQRPNGNLALKISDLFVFFNVKLDSASPAGFTATIYPYFRIGGLVLCGYEPGTTLSYRTIYSEYFCARALQDQVLEAFRPTAGATP